MYNLSQTAGVPVIAAIVYGTLALYKYLVTSEKGRRLIPALAAVLGAALGITAYYAAPEVIAAANVLSAALIGGASGLAATGANQVYKQLTKDYVKDDEEKEKKE